LIEYDIRIVFVAHGIRFLTDYKLLETPFQEDAAIAELQRERFANIKTE
jgi:hypothetical protein